MAAATSCIPARRFGSGNAVNRNVSSLSATDLPLTSIAALVMVKPEPSWMMRAVSVKTCPGDTKVRNFAALTDAVDEARVQPLRQLGRCVQEQRRLADTGRAIDGRQAQTLQRRTQPRQLLVAPDEDRRWRYQRLRLERRRSSLGQSMDVVGVAFQDPSPPRLPPSIA